jgi:type III secretion system FlhB-like substrate exporter
MENTNGDGYISEKIIDSFLSGTIPIYYGDYMLEEYINPKTYILIKGIEDLDKKIEYIKKIDNNAELYKYFLKEKVLLDKSIIEQFYKTYDEFLINIFKQEKNVAKRK